VVFLKDNLEIDINEQKNINENTSNLNNSIEEYEFIIENANDVISILNQDFEYLFINTLAYKKVLGYSEEDLIGKSLLSLIYPDDVKNDMNITRKEIAESSQTQQMRIRHKDGQYLWFEMKGKKFKDKSNVEKILLIAREINELKLTEQKLKESEEKYLRITENVNDLIQLLNQNYEFEYINENSALKLLGYKKEDLIGKSILDYINPGDIELMIKILNNTFNLEQEKIEIRFKNRLGHWIWFENQFKTYYDKDKEIKWLIISRDITERKLAEERYKNLFETSPNAIILTNFNGVAIDANSTFKKLIGFDKEDVIGKDMNELNEIFSQEIKFYFKKIFKASFKGEFPESIEIQIKRKDDNYIWVNLQSSLFKMDSKTLIQFIFQDITEKKKNEILEKQFKEQLEGEVQNRTKELNDTLEKQKLYLDQILKSSQFKTEFMSTMSHELRTPLNAIIGFAELLLEEAYGPLNKEQLDFLNDIKSSAEHQSAMIQNILDISKIEAGQILLNIQKFSLNNIIYQIKSSLEPIYKEKGLKFTIKGLDTEKEIYADPIRFKEILLNLLTNAIKFTIEGEITLNIREEYDYWIIRVSDTGIGIARKDFDLIFKEFKRVDSTYVRSVPGTGLGLSLTKRLVNLHGGEISFFSVLGAGTTFTFSISKELGNK